MGAVERNEAFQVKTCHNFIVCSQMLLMFGLRFTFTMNLVQNVNYCIN